MKLLIDSKHKDALHKGCIEQSYDVQFHETDEPEILHAYVMNRGRDLTQSQAFWLGVWYRNELSRELLEA